MDLVASRYGILLMTLGDEGNLTYLIVERIDFLFFFGLLTDILISFKRTIEYSYLEQDSLVLV